MYLNNNFNDFNNSVVQYLNEIRNNKVYTKKEEKELWETYHNSTDNFVKTECRNKIITANLKFVVIIAKTYKGKGLPFSDLIAEGNIGLCKAFDKFDSTRDVKFFSFAVWWIKATINEALNKRNMLLTSCNPSDEFDYDDGNDDIYDESYINKPYVHKTINSDYMSQDDEDVKYFVNHLLSSLSKRERSVLIDLYGLNGGTRQTLKSVAPKYGLSSETIRQIQLESLNKIKKTQVKNG